MSTNDDSTSATDDERRPIGDVIDALGVKATLNEGELAASAVVLLRVIEADGDERLSIAFSEGQSWIERLGVLRAAENIEATGIAMVANHHHSDDD